MEDILPKIGVMENQVKPGYKKTKLGWIPEDWEISTLEKVTIGKPKYGINAAAVEFKPNLPVYLRITDIDESGNFKKEKRKSVNSVDSKNYLLKHNDLVFARTGATVGKTYLHSDKNGELVYAGFLIRFRPNPKKIHPGFIKLFTETSMYNKWVQVYSMRSGQPGINSQEYCSLPVPKPRLSEQKEIFQAVSYWTQSLNNLEFLIQKKKLEKKGLMKQLFTGKKRLPGFSGEWKEHSYRELLKEVKRDFEWNDNEKYDLISVRRRSGGLFHRDSLFGHQIKTKNLRTAKAGDFLISKMQIVHGASGLTTDDFNGMKISGSYIALVSRDEDVFDINFLNWYSKLPEFYHQCYISSYGVHIEKMTFDFKLFLKEKITIPELDEQRAIINVLESSQKEIELLKKKKEMLQTQKKGLMQQLLTGKKRITT
jgi:type I restriction enzyme S subunit